MYNYNSESLDNFQTLVEEFIAFKKSVGETPVLPGSIHSSSYNNDLYVMKNQPSESNESYLSPMPNDEIPNNNIKERIETDMADPELSTPNIDFYSDDEIDGMDEIMALDADMAVIRNLMSEINQKLYPFIIEVLNEYEYEGSPVFGDTMDREFIAQLVDRVLEKAVEAIEEVEEIHMDAERGNWCRFRMLRAVTEINVLMELSGTRRPCYRRVLGKCHRLF